MVSPADRFRQGFVATRARLNAREVARRDEQAEAQAAYEAREREREAEWQRRRGPQIPPDERDRQGAERAAEIESLRGLLEQLPAEQGRLTAEITEAVRRGDLEAAVTAQVRLAALEPVRGAAGRRLRQLGLESDGRPRPPMTFR